MCWCCWNHPLYKLKANFPTKEFFLGAFYIVASPVLEQAGGIVLFEGEMLTFQTTEHPFVVRF